MLRAAVTYRFENKVGPYLEALRAAGAEPVGVTPDQSPAVTSLDGFAGLVLTGGTDVAPARYGQSPHAETEAPDEARDELEFRLLREALERGLPVLAICRGMQLFNVFHGGTLLQHLDGHAVRPNDKSQPVHSVEIAGGTRLGEIFGVSALPVNSRHHQAVDKPGTGLLVSARSVADGIVEGLERPDCRFAVAVQWHPEDQPAHAPLFAAFASVL
jgi:gamma-glutamyl-gamma-aminobutyrate hydrolase PuuD